MPSLDFRAGFRWNDGSAERELRLPMPLLFRGNSYGHVDTRFRSMGLDQRTTVTTVLSGGAEVLAGTIRFSSEPSGLLAMLRDGANGHIIRYYPDLDGAAENYPFLLDDFGDVTISLDPERFSAGEWERTITMRRIDGGSFDVLVSNQLLFLTADRLPSGMDFSRASGATRRTANGEIRQVDTGTLRVNYAEVGGTLRPFLLIEPERTNLIPIGSEFFEGDWAVVSGANVTVTPTGATIPGVSPPDAAAHITADGGSSLAKYQISLAAQEGTFSGSMWVVNQGDQNLDIRLRQGSEGTTQTIEPEETAWVAIDGVSSGGIETVALIFQTQAIGHEIDCLAFLPQIEEGAFATSWFIGDPRAAEELSFAFPFDPMPMAGYARILVSGGNEGGERVFQISGTSAGGSPRLFIAWATSEQLYTLNYHNGTELQLGAVDLDGVERGALIEFAWVLRSDGSGRLVAQVAGEAMDAAAMPAPDGGLAATWAGTRYNAGNVGSSAIPGDNHDRHLVVPLRAVTSSLPADGTGDAAFLAEMRKKAGAS